MASKKTKSKPAAKSKSKPAAKKSAAKKPAAKGGRAAKARDVRALKKSATKKREAPALKRARRALGKRPKTAKKTSSLGTTFSPNPPYVAPSAEAKAAANEAYGKVGAKPVISEMGHAAHVTRKNAPAVQAALLDALKVPLGFDALETRFPGLTKNQIRYQLSNLREEGLVTKSGSRDSIVYQAAKR